MFGDSVNGHDVGQIDFGGSRRREFYLRFFGGFLQTLQSHGVSAQVETRVFGFKFVGEPVYYYLVEIVAAEVSVTVGGLHFKYPVAEFEYGDVERSAAEIEHRNLYVFVPLLVQSVGECCRGGFVDDALYLQSCYFARFLGCLTLRIAEICGHGNNSFGHFLSEIVFGGFLHFLENHRRYFLRSIFPVVYQNARRIVVAAGDFVGYTFDFQSDPVVGLAHETFNREDRTFRVSYRLSFCGVADFTFAVFRKRHD